MGHSHPLPPAGWGEWSYLLRGWQGAGLQDSFLFSWGGVLSPRGGGEEDHGDGVEGRRAVSKKKGKAALCPWLRAVSLWGGGGNRRSCSPFGERTVEGEWFSQVLKI